MRVLVVEDELRMAALLRRGLAEDGYAVDVAATGYEGFWHACEFDYDAVLLDVMLPGISGIEVCRQLRERKRWVPILMLTARDAIEDRVRGRSRRLPGQALSFDDMAARMRALIRRGGVERPTELRVADLRLDPSSRRAWRGDVELELSVKEFTLLRLLLTHPGQVLTRAQIIEHVWDYAYEGVSNVVDQYVLYLRRKIDGPFRVTQLETGAGSRLPVMRTAATHPFVGSCKRREVTRDATATTLDAAVRAGDGDSDHPRRSVVHQPAESGSLRHARHRASGATRRDFAGTHL
jgi:two-component system OmpR family response regulator